MGKLDSFLDDMLFKAKNIADNAGKKTGEVVEIGKLKYQAKQITWDIERAYSKLGAIVYESRKSNESFDEVITLATEEIDSLRSKLEDVEKKILDFKKLLVCSNCGKNNDEASLFCSRCGSVLGAQAPEDHTEAEPEEESHF